MRDRKKIQDYVSKNTFNFLEVEGILNTKCGRKCINDDSASGMLLEIFDILDRRIASEKNWGINWHPVGHKADANVKKFKVKVR
jgi:hypothetical protein